MPFKFSIFSRAKNVRISGQARLQINNFGSGGESLDEGIRLLVSRVVAGAMHNSGDRFDAPTCHEETRIAIQDDILGWADELIGDLNQLVTWMYGPAGAGKTAIAQTIAQKWHDRGQLTASFFFSRASGNTGRGTETDFVATLAHQLSQTVPATQPHIATAIRTNPLVFELSLQDQVDALIVAPLIAISSTSSGFERPRVIVVDGLDECRQEREAQRRVVDALISGLRRVPHLSHKLFITSRPEYNIVSIFNKYEDKLVRKMELDNRWNPDEDIRTFLKSSFADIRRSHFYFRKHPVDQLWPSPKDIETLVCRSSGQFIYASVVLKYIKSEENYNPAARLKTILQLKNNGDRPYAELDALYHHIFSQIRDAERFRVLTILHLDQEYDNLLDGDYRSAPTLENFLSEFIGVDEDEIEFCLRPLVSLLVWENGSEEAFDYGGIRYMHASLRDFLLDPSRSNIFCINMQTRAVGIVCRAIELLEGGTALTVPRCLIPLITILSYYSESMRDDDEGFRIYSLVSNFNVVETVLCKIDADLIDDELASALKSYIDWLLEESEYTSDPLRALLQPTLAQIKTWLVNQFDKLDFHNLNNTEQIDVWPFFTPYCIDFGDGYPTSVSENLSSALKICGSSPSCHRDLRGTRFNLSNRTAVLCFLLPHLVRPSDSDYSLTPGSDSWLMESDFLGRHAMSRERYGTALQRVIYYLLQLPEAVLLKILHVSDSKKAILFTPIMRLIRAILHTFFYRSPCTTDLYFLVALASPVLRKVGMVDDISGYTYGALTEFPFLNNTTDLDYIRAKRQVEEACIKRKIKTSLRELVERMGLTGMQSVAYKELLGSFAGIDKRAPQSS